MAGWADLEVLISNLSPDDRALLSRYTALDLSAGPDAVAATLRAFAQRSPDSTPSVLLATAGAHAAQAGEEDFARRIGGAALDIAATSEERRIAHVCLAQTHFRRRRDGAELEAFIAHCRAAVDLGHTGTFCYERLAVLYEYRGDLDGAIEICRRAVNALSGAGDDRSAGRFKRRLARLSAQRAG
ncbi:MAG TPA: hypothetical protein VHM16_04235 [Rubrobacteraceae bacterium]|nr:hypothetical protein [Rubrobacteraceae bacterium]